MIYLDSSSLLKLLWNEPETAAVVAAIDREPAVVISALTELETLIQLKAAFLGGEYSRQQWRRLETQLALLRNRPPYDFRSLRPGSNGEKYRKTLPHSRRADLRPRLTRNEGDRRQRVRRRECSASRWN